MGRHTAATSDGNSLAIRVHVIPCLSRAPLRAGVESAPVEVENTERPRIRLLLARLARRRAIRGKRPGMLSSRRVALVVNGGLQSFHIEPVHAAAAETATG